MEIKTNNCDIPKIWKKTGSYRLGDTLLVYKTIDFSDHHFITDKNFEGTILNRFALKIKNHQNKNNRCLICAEIINEMLKEKKYECGAENDLVIHIRLGDVFGLDNDLCITKRPILNKIIDKIKKFKGEKIYIVAAYSYGKGVFSSPEVVEKGQKNSEEFLNKILQSIPKEINYEIKSSDNVDDDFIFLAASKNLCITGGSCFSKAAYIVNKYLLKMI